MGTCNPADFLKFKTFELTEESLLNYQYFSYLNKESDKKYDGSVMATIYGVPVQAKYAQETLSRINSVLDYSINSAQRRTLLTSSLDDGGIKAYSECLKSKDPISVQFQGNLSARDEFFLTVSWHPNYPIDKTVSEIFIETINANTNSSKKEIARDGSISFKFSRNPNKDSEIRISIDNKEETILIPSRVRYKLEAQLIKGPVLKYKAEQTHARPIIEAYVEAPKNSIIVPGTFKDVKIYWNVQNREQVYDDKKQTDTALRASRTFTFSTPTIQNYADIAVQGQAIAVRSVPIIYDVASLNIDVADSDDGAYMFA